MQLKQVSLLFDILVDFVCVAWIGGNPLLTGNWYQFVTMTDGISNANFKSKFSNITR